MDELVVYRDMSEDIRKIDFDVFAIGEEQRHVSFQTVMAYCEQAWKSVVRMKRTEVIASSKIKNRIRQKRDLICGNIIDVTHNYEELAKKT